MQIACPYPSSRKRIARQVKRCWARSLGLPKCCPIGSDTLAPESLQSRQIACGPCRSKRGFNIGTRAQRFGLGQVVFVQYSGMTAFGDHIFQPSNQLGRIMRDKADATCHCDAPCLQCVGKRINIRLRRRGLSQIGKGGVRRQIPRP